MAGTHIKNHARYERVLRNFDKAAHQFQSPALRAEDGVGAKALMTAHGRGYQKLEPREVYLLLEQRAEWPTKAAASALLTAMANKRWKVVSTAKRGGIGRDGQADDTLHITLEVGRPPRYHLKVREVPTGLILQSITR